MPLTHTTAERVVANTPEEINERIRRRTEDSIAAAARGGHAAIARRLAELDREWDIERCLETGAASLTLLGSALGATVDRRWFALPAAVAAFLLQHTVQGWCPPLPLFRRLGVRTADEINCERYALKALRGDFAQTFPAHERAVNEAIIAITPDRNIKH
jgi:hypothetical protein